MGATASVVAAVHEYERLKKEGGHPEDEIIARLKLRFHEFGIGAPEPRPLTAAEIAAAAVKAAQEAAESAESKGALRRGSQPRKDSLRKSTSMNGSLRSTNNHLNRSGSLKKQGSGEGLVRRDSGAGPLSRKPSIERHDSNSTQSESKSGYRRSTSNASDGRPASRGGTDAAGHKRRDSNGQQQLSKLSGRPPALSTDFSSLEQMTEEADKEGAHHDQAQAGGAQEDTTRRRQSYFRTGGFVRPSKKFTLDPSSKDLLAKTPHSMRRPSKTQGQGGEGGRPQSRGGGRGEGAHQETAEGPTAMAAGGGGGADGLASTERLPDGGLMEHVDTWDSVSAEPVCMICKMAFHSSSKLERHLKYSQMHARNAEALRQMVAGNRQPPPSYYERNIKWEYRLIYSGSKFFWRTSRTVDVNMYLYEAQGADSLVLILPYDPTADKELSPLYVSWAKVFAQVDDEDLLVQATELFTRQSPEARMGTDVETIHMDMRRRAVVTYLLIRLQLLGPGEGELPAVAPTKKADKHTLQMTVAKLGTDEYDSLLVDKVPFLSKLNVPRQPRSSTGDIEGKISEVMCENQRAKEDLGRAEGHLESLKKTLDRMDTLSASQQVMDVNPTSPRSRLSQEELLLAVPKKGRLCERVVRILEGAGLEHRRPERVDVAKCTGLPVTLVFLPAADIAAYVGEGNVDMGITGQDIVMETRLGTPNLNVNELLELGFGKCSLSLQAPVVAGYKSAEELSGSRIVTSYPALAREYFDKIDQKTKKQTKIRTVSGSVEAACGLGLADAVVDLVETGTTMKAAGLDVVSDVLKSQAVLISNPHSPHQDLIDLILQRITGYITATQYMMISYNVTRQKLPATLALTPGKRSPTVSTLDESDAVAVQALVKRSESSLKMDQLHDAGATDILLFSIANSRM